MVVAIAVSDMEALFVNQIELCGGEYRAVIRRL